MLVHVYPSLAKKKSSEEGWRSGVIKGGGDAEERRKGEQASYEKKEI